MLSALAFRLSPSRRRFMRRFGRPALSRFNARLHAAGSADAVKFISVLLRANADFLAHALSSAGQLKHLNDRATIEGVEQCLASLLVYSVNLFARDEMAKSESELLALVAEVIGRDPESVMLMRNALRKSPRSEEWMLVTWLAEALGAGRPAYEAELERNFAYQYLSYIGQYRPFLEREVARI